MTELSLTLHRGMADIPAADWDACAGGGNPFVSHAFLLRAGGERQRHRPLRLAAAARGAARRKRAPRRLRALLREEPQPGRIRLRLWLGRRLRARRRRLLPEAPGLRALQPGPRPAPAAARRGSGVPATALADGLAQACGQFGLSSVHVTFCEEAEWEALGEAGWLQRLGTQFHWQNAGYAELRRLPRRPRLAQAQGDPARAARRRGRRLRPSAPCAAAEITPAHWKAFHRFYRSTTDKKWGRSAYLTPRFWPLMAEALGDAVVLMVAERNGEPVAGALNLLGRDALYGRNWGCGGGRALPAFRALLLPRHRLRHRARRLARRGRRAGRAQDPARLPAAARPTPRTGSSTPGCGARSATSWRASARRCCAEIATLAELSPFRRDCEAD